MKLRKLLGATIVALVSMATVGGKATAKDSHDLLVPYEASVAGRHIASGRYKVECQTHSPEATVTFSKENKVVATAEGKIVDRGETYTHNTVVYDEKPDGSRVIIEIRFRDSSQAIVFQD
jgi:hypothetical protein